MREIRTSGSQRGKATSVPSGVPSLLYRSLRMYPALCKPRHTKENRTSFHLAHLASAITLQKINTPPPDFTCFLEKSPLVFWQSYLAIKLS